MGLPRAVSLKWDEHEAFAPLRVQGPNPAWLRRAPELARLAVGCDVDAARVFAVDFREFLTGLPVRPGRFVHPCVALFAEGDAAQGGGLAPLGISMTTDGGSVWVPADGSARWTRARRYFHNAEIHVHEAVSHFLWTHVFGEKLLLATVRHLDTRHPIRRLLEPHFDATLQANEKSGGLLLGPNGFFERCFSAGWTGIAELIRRGDRAWRYERMVLPRELTSRGVMDLAAYPYRDDGLLLWGALQRYVGAVVGAWFGDDTAVAADPELAAWSAELGGWLGDRGFPAVQSRETLVEVLTATLFNVVQHTFVNAQQYDAFGEPAIWPAAVSARFADEAEGAPVGVEAIDAVRATYGFSIQYNVLGAGIMDWHDEKTREAAKALLRELEGIERTMAAREGARPWSYGIAHPSRVSNSINA